MEVATARKGAIASTTTTVASELPWQIVVRTTLDCLLSVWPRPRVDKSLRFAIDRAGGATVCESRARQYD